MQQTLWAQDSTIQYKIHSPKKATNRSAILPGLGQAYNKQYFPTNPWVSHTAEL